ncbi:rhodanese-related sulfurtransferase [Candidatus Parcubacteria bacterium]|nr:rhodanese-related sulfurtransferase [Candidatus Parcubacteria bacterium]
MLKEVNYTIILFYKFTRIANPDKFRDKQRAIAADFGLTGRILVAKEGINATLEGTTKNIKGYMKELRKQKVFQDVVFKQSAGFGKAFTKLQVKTRPEVVTLGVGELNIKKDTAPVVTAAKLEKMYQKDEDFVVLDLRNNYEVEAGYFEKTVNPNLKNFRDLPAKLKELEHLKDKKVVAVCTGGIRCEKATVLMKKEGFKNIFQLKDGIHTYMKKYPGKHFKGGLFVFDNRMLTSVEDTKNREVVGKCFDCQVECEIFYNDDSVRPSKKVICCDVCIARHKRKLRPAVPV